jgi:hypothetical protein
VLRLVFKSNTALVSEVNPPIKTLVFNPNLLVPDVKPPIKTLVFIRHVCHPSCRYSKSNLLEKQTYSHNQKSSLWPASTVADTQRKKSRFTTLKSYFLEPCSHHWLIDYLRFYVPLKNFSLVWRRHHCRWRAAKCWPTHGAQGLWAGRDIYRATPTVTRDLGFSGLIWRTAGPI